LPSQLGLGSVIIASSHRDGATEIYSDRAGYGASTLPVQPSEFLDEHFTVTVNRLDTLISTHHLPRPDILKIDVQGAELEVLRGAGILIKEIQIIQAEVWFQRGYGPDTPLFNEVYDFLNGFGFCLIELGELYYNAKRELAACDAYFVQGTVLERLAPKLPKDCLTMTTNPMFRKRKFWRSFSGY
jgi:Methyltransferase FkbM domain